MPRRAACNTPLQSRSGRRTIEHVFGTHVGTEMSLSVLAYNFKRVLNILGPAKTKRAMRLLGA